MKSKILLYACTILILGLILSSCIESKNWELIPIQEDLINISPLNEEGMKVWYYKDILQDSISGISLDRAYNTILKNSKGKEVIVAILDTEIDINHEDLKESIWVNKNEIENNGVDDDKNGYIDDINGWNFIGNSKGDNVIYSSAECVRILQKLQKEFENRAKSYF